MSGNDAFSVFDRRAMAACIRLARRHRGLTGTNPSVATLLNDADGAILGKGVTAKGGRPHAEPLALAAAGPLPTGTTAYVTLEPCAHHGVTPPCAQALIDAGVARVVTAWTDPDERVDGKGHAMLRAAGIAVNTGLFAQEAAADLSGYLSRKRQHRPHILLKLAVSEDGFLGREGEETAITGPLARTMVHRMRAENDAILVGSGTIAADDPELTCRLPGLSARSPLRVLLDPKATLGANSKLGQSARKFETFIVTPLMHLPEPLTDLGVKRIGAEIHEGVVALPELLSDLAETGVSTLMVEGGAKVAQSFIDHDLVDEIALFSAPLRLGSGIASPIKPDAIPSRFALQRSLDLAGDRLQLFSRID